MIGGDFLDLSVFGRVEHFEPGFPGRLQVHRLVGGVGIEPPDDGRGARDIHRFPKIFLGQGEIFRVNLSEMAGVERENPHVGVLNESQVEDFQGKDDVVEIVKGDEGSDFVGVHVPRVELADDGKDMKKMILPVRDGGVSVILDRPDKKDVGRNRGIAERGHLQIFSRRDIQNPGSGDCPPGDFFDAKLEAGEGEDQRDESESKSDRPLHRSGKIPSAEYEHGQSQDESGVDDPVGRRGEE